jgi:hypothetical protein
MENPSCMSWIWIISHESHIVFHGFYMAHVILFPGRSAVRSAGTGMATRLRRFVVLVVLRLQRLQASSRCKAMGMCNMQWIAVQQ